VAIEPEQERRTVLVGLLAGWRDLGGGVASAQVLAAAMVVFLAVRAVHVSQAAISVSAAPDAYSRPEVAVGVALGVAVWSAVVAVVGIRRHEHGWGIARADALSALVGLVVLALATPAAARTTSLFWMLPYAVGAAVGLGLTTTDASAIVLVAVLSAAYLGLNASALEAGGGPLATAVVNALSIPSFYGITVLLATGAKRFATELDRARASTLGAERALAAAAEGRRYQRLIHDSVLQVLDAMAVGRVGDTDQMRRRARREARSIRTLLSSDPTPAGLSAALEHLAAVVEEESDVAIVFTAEAGLPEPDVEHADALVGATREALANVVRHSGAASATVRLQRLRDGIEVVVRDDGKGFDPDMTPPGFGLSQSIQGRMGEIDGLSTVRSAVGQGTTVRLWSPRQ